MREDFNWLRGVLRHPDNSFVHFDSLYNLVKLFKNKWKHYEKDPKHKHAYWLYVSYLRIALKWLNR